MKLFDKCLLASAMASALRTKASVSVIALLLMVPVAHGQSATAPTKEDLVKSLKCQDEIACPPASSSTTRRRRGVSSPPPSARRGFEFQPLTDEERNRLDEAARLKKLPTADIEIYFDLDKAVVTAAAQTSLRPLGEALIDPALNDQQFVLVGHTDAYGTDAYNQDLSERRANAVKDYLIKTFGIVPDRLTAYGRGKTILKNANAPFASENRRVQVINFSAVAGNTR